MAIDMSQFHALFFEETAEHLAALEGLLLAVDPAAPDREQLDAVFRAAHSIKGSAATFGFDDLARVTHLLEGLLDRIRRRELALDRDMIDAFLAAGDLLKGLLAAHRSGGMTDAAAIDAICARLAAIGAGPGAPAAPTAAATPAREAGYDIRFVLAPGGRGDVAGNLLAELEGLGRVRVLQRPAEGAADGPWHLELITGAGEPAVVGLLEFVVRSDSLRVAPLGRPVGDPAGAYGFFDDEEPAAPGAPAPSTAGPVAYEFFDEEPGGAPAAAVIPAREGEGYGFFADLPAPAPKPAAVPAAGRPVAEASIRVGIGKVDRMVDLVGELVITQAMITQSAAVVDPVLCERLMGGLAQLERNTRELQEAVMSMRMLPISTVFSRFPRLVHDLSQKLGKEVELKLEGEATELDRGLIERIVDPLTHLVRNSLDHGIEAPEVRVARGKPRAGSVTLSACHKGGSVVIEVADDGAGLDRERILAKARERGLPASDAMSDQEVWALVFEPGFSTAETVTEISGRGVGMDVVKENIAALGGRVDLESRAGLGARMTVRLPLTLAILDALSVAVGPETYLIPLAYVVESLQATRAMVKSLSGEERLLRLRQDYLPLLALAEAFRIPGGERDFERGIMVVLESDGIRAALFVDALLGQHQVVIKSLEANYRKVPGISGATIMGDGRVAMILDGAALVARARAAVPAET